MRISVAVDWPFWYTTCWVEFTVSCWSSESLESGESDWTFIFLIDFSSEWVEVTEDPAPGRKFELFSSIDEFGLYPLRLLARSSQAAFSSGFLSPSKMSSSSSWWLTNSRQFSPGRSDSSLFNSLFRRLNELVDWEVLTSTGTEARVVFSKGLLFVLLRRYVWGLEGGKRGLLLPCDGMISTKSNIQRQRGGEKRQWNANANHLENEVYRNSNYAKKNKNRCRLV